MSFEAYRYLNNEIKKVKISADGEKAVRVEVDDVKGFRSVFSFVDDYLLDMERYINKLQAEMDKERVWKEKLMGKEYDDSVIG